MKTTIPNSLDTGSKTVHDGVWQNTSHTKHSSNVSNYFLYYGGDHRFSHPFMQLEFIEYLPHADIKITHRVLMKSNCLNPTPYQNRKNQPCKQKLKPMPKHQCLDGST